MICLVLSALSYSTKAQDRNCHTMDVYEQQVQQNPSLQLKMQGIEKRTQQFINSSEQARSAAVSGVITIPVVVHVLYSNSNENISSAQIQSQIDVLNEDYRRLNGDANQVPNEFSSVASDIEVEFVMATTDPNGNPTSGITRKSTSRTSWGTNDDMKKNLTRWSCSMGCISLLKHVGL